MSTRGRLATYWEEARGIELSLLLVLPLLMAYEIAMLLVDAPLRNGAEVAFSRLAHELPPSAFVVLRRLVLAALLVATLVCLRRASPRVARAHWILGEALLLAVVLGPLVGLLVGLLGLSASGEPLAVDLATVAAPSPWLPLLLSVGAGLWEEIVFRLLVLGGTFALLVRVLATPRLAALGVAIGVSSLLFALYHHLGALGEPWEARRFAFRATAGIILGLLFALRGLAVVVYMHVFYDILCDLQSG